MRDFIFLCGWISSQVSVHKQTEDFVKGMQEQQLVLHGWLHPLLLASPSLATRAGRPCHRSSCQGLEVPKAGGIFPFPSLLENFPFPSPTPPQPAAVPRVRGVPELLQLGCVEAGTYPVWGGFPFPIPAPKLVRNTQKDQARREKPAAAAVPGWVQACTASHPGQWWEGRREKMPLSMEKKGDNV